MNEELQTQQDSDSKTKRKKEMLALQQLGASLTDYNNAQLNSLPLSAELRQAIDEYKRLPNSHGAKRRQLQFIGRLMRKQDSEAISKAIDSLHQGIPADSQNENTIEDYCNRVLSEGDKAINELVLEHPYLERQALRKYHLDFLKISDESDSKKTGQLTNSLQKYLRKNL